MLVHWQLLALLPRRMIHQRQEKVQLLARNEDEQLSPPACHEVSWCTACARWSHPRPWKFQLIADLLASWLTTMPGCAHHPIPGSQSCDSVAHARGIRRITLADHLPWKRPVRPGHHDTAMAFLSSKEVAELSLGLLGRVQSTRELRCTGDHRVLRSSLACVWPGIETSVEARLQHGSTEAPRTLAIVALVSCWVRAGA